MHDSKPPHILPNIPPEERQWTGKTRQGKVIKEPKGKGKEPQGNSTLINELISNDLGSGPRHVHSLIAAVAVVAAAPDDTKTQLMKGVLNITGGYSNKQSHNGVGGCNKGDLKPVQILSHIRQAYRAAVADPAAVGEDHAAAVADPE